MLLFVCLLVQALLIPASVLLVAMVFVFFRIQAVEAIFIRMFGDTRHNGWFAVVLVWTVVWTLVGWNHPAFITPLESLNVAERAASAAGDRETAVERLDEVSGILQLGSLMNWADPAAEEPESSTWRGSAAVASWIILLASAVWVWSDDAIALFALVGALFSRQTASASTTAGGGQQAAVNPAPAGATSAGTTSLGRLWQRYGDDFAIEALFKFPDILEKLKTFLNRR